MAATKWIELEEETQEWVCTCGNTSGGAGFHTCLEDGTEVEPSIGGEWAGHYICGDCDAIILGIWDGEIHKGQIIGQAA